jgi:membrane protein implicated in regulation of membrane protease activity
MAMDLLSAVFLGCFVFGFVAVVASFLLGGMHALHVGDLHLDLPGHHFDVQPAHGAHLAHHGHGGTDDGVFPVNPTTVLTFLTWFGGAGFILRNYYGVVAVVSLIAAALVGLVGAAVVFVFLLKFVLPEQTVMRQADYDPVGSVGRLSMPIRAGGVGEVVYRRGGTRRSAGACSLDGRALDKGAEVVIARYERGLAYVQPWEEFVSREGRLNAAEGN